jgi:multidrug resistance efflux pump
MGNRRKFSSGRVHPHIFPVLVWLAAVACIVVLFKHQTQRFEILGVARGPVYEISSSVDGNLKIVSVELFDDVHKGQVLAMLDDSQLTAQISVIQSEIEHLKALLASTEDAMLAEASNLETDKVAAQQRFMVDAENSKLRVLEQKALIEADKVTLESLAVELKISKELLEKDAITVYEFERSESLYKALATKIEESENIVIEAEKNYEQARKRSEEFAQLKLTHPSANKALETISKQIDTQQKLIDEVTLQREALKIKSPIDGRITQILVSANQAVLRRHGEDVIRRHGETVQAGEPILAVAQIHPTEIVAYVSEDKLSRIKENMAVELVKRTDPARVANSQLVKLGPTMERLPEQLWPNPNIAQWGRPVLIKIPPGFDLFPGETVGIRGL